jgi:hypothetical protein
LPRNWIRNSITALSASTSAVDSKTTSNTGPPVSPGQEHQI